MEGLPADFACGLVRIAIGSLIGAVFLRAAAAWVVKEHPSYGKAYVTFFLMAFCNQVIAFLIGFSIGFVVAFTIPQSESTLLLAEVLAMLIAIPACFFAASGIVYYQLDLTYPKAMLVTLVTYAVAIAVGLVVMLIVFGAIFVFGLEI